MQGQMLLLLRDLHYDLGNAYFRIRFTITITQA